MIVAAVGETVTVEVASTTVTKELTVVVDVTVESPETVDVPPETITVVVVVDVGPVVVVVVDVVETVAGGERFNILEQILLPGMGCLDNTFMMTGMAPCWHSETGERDSGDRGTAADICVH